MWCKARPQPPQPKWATEADAVFAVTEAFVATEADIAVRITDQIVDITVVPITARLTIAQLIIAHVPFIMATALMGRVVFGVRPAGSTHITAINCALHAAFAATEL
jgi:hypothetical protein